MPDKTEKPGTASRKQGVLSDNLSLLIDRKAIGKRIRDLRIEKYGNCSRQKIKDFEKFDFLPEHYKKIELGLKPPTLSTLIQIALLYDVSVEYLLFGGKKDKSRNPLKETDRDSNR